MDPDPVNELVRLRTENRELLARVAELERRCDPGAAHEIQYRSLFEASADGIFLLDENGFIDCNPAGARMFGVPREALAGRSPADFSPERQPDGRLSAEAAADIKAAALAGEIRHFDWVCRHADGSLVDAQITVSRAGEPGRSLLMAMVRDVTARKTEERNEARLRTYYEKSPLGIAAVDSWTGKFLRVNPAFCRIVGRSAGEMLETDFGSITHPDEVEDNLATLRRMRAGEIDEFQGEKRYVRPDGTAVWVNLKVVPLWEPGERPRTHLAMVEDIAERKRAEQALRESEKLYRSLFENIGDGVFLTNARGTIHAANPAACDLLGMTEQEICALGRAGLIDPEDARLGPGLEQRRLTGRVQSELRLVRKDGSKFETEIRSVLLSEGGGAFAMVRDITGQKRAEAALRESERQFRAYYEQAPLGIALVDSRTCKFVEVNPAYCRIAGRSREQLLGTDFRTITHPDEVRPNLEGMRRLCEGEASSYETEKRYLRPDGSAVWARLKVVAFSEPGGSRELHLVMAEDITEQKRMRQELEASEEKLRRIFLLTPEPMSINDLEDGLRYLDVNEAFERVTGWSREQTIGRTVGELGLWADPGQREEAFRQFRAEGRIRGFEHQIRRRDGTTGTLLLSLEPLSSGGRLLGIVASMDITGRKRADQELREALRFNQQIIDSARDGVIVYGPDMRYRAWNRFMEELTGVPASEALGRHPLELFPFLRETGVIQIIERALAGESPEAVELPYWLPKSGRRGWNSHVSGPLRNQAGEIIGAIATVREISESKLAQERVRESERRFRAIFDSAPISLWEMDLSEAKKYLDELARANVNLAEYFGLHPEEVARRLGILKLVDANPATLDLLEARDIPEVLIGWTRLMEGVPAQTIARVAVALHTGCPRLRYEISFPTFRGRHLNCQVDLSVMPGAEDSWSRVLLSVVDITAVKQTQEALRASEERLAAIFRCSPAAIAISDLEGGDALVEVNDTFEKVTGYRSDEAVGRTTGELHIFPETAEYERAVRLLRENGFLENFEIRIRRKDGEIRSGLLSAGPVIIHGRRLVASATIDITARRRAERDLEQANLRLSLALASGALGIWEWDVLADSLAWDDRIHEQYGLSREDFGACYEAWRSRLHPEDRAPVHDAVQAALGNERQFDLEFRVVGPGGEPRHIKAGGLVIRDADGRPVRMIGLSQDITGRKRADAALRESNERFVKAFRSAPLLLAIARLEDGTYVDVNDFAFETVGYSRDEVIGHKSTEIGWITPEDRKRLLAELNERGKVAGLEMEFTAKGGRKIIGLVHGERIVVDGEDCLLTVTTDITDRKRQEKIRAELEAQLFQAQKMESIGRLAGGVAHDFNNLLTVINGYSVMALADLSPEDPFRAQMEEIHKAGERAAALTRQLLAFSRKQVLQPKRLNLNRTVEDMRSMLARIVGEDVELALELSPQDLFVNADPHQLQQVIMNLAVNARDAMPGGGYLRIETCLETPREDRRTGPEERPQHRAMLAVSDTGIGMDEATRERIFEPFFTTKGVGEGTGLGLPMVQGIVAQSGGSIEVRSEPGEGTTFRIYLPVLETAMPGAEKRPPAATTGGRETILLVEDQAEVRRYVTQVLKSYGYRVIPAAGGREAIAACEREPAPIHLLLTDVVMPGESGREVATRCARMRPGLKILFMSGYTGDVTERHQVSGEGCRFIQKPFSPEELAREIRVALGVARPASVLVAGNEAGVRSFFRTVLEAGGYGVLEAVDANQAIARARTGKPDLVLMDIATPGPEGIEDIRALRRDAPGPAIIAVSGALGGEYWKMAQMAGADGVLTKPVSPEVLLRKVADTLHKGTPPAA